MLANREQRQILIDNGFSPGNEFAADAYDSCKCNREIAALDAGYREIAAWLSIRKGACVQAHQANLARIRSNIQKCEMNLKKIAFLKKRAAEIEQAKEMSEADNYGPTDSELVEELLDREDEVEAVKALVLARYNSGNILKATKLRDGRILVTFDRETLLKSSPQSPVQSSRTVTFAVSKFEFQSALRKISDSSGENTIIDETVKMAKTRSLRSRRRVHEDLSFSQGSLLIS